MCVCDGDKRLTFHLSFVNNFVSSLLYFQEPRKRRCQLLVSQASSKSVENHIHTSISFKKKLLCWWYHWHHHWLYSFKSMDHHGGVSSSALGTWQVELAFFIPVTLNFNTLLHITYYPLKYIWGLSEHEDRSGGKRRGRRCWQGQRGARAQSINRERYQSSPHHFPQKSSSRRYYTIKGKPIAAVCGSIYWKLCCYSAASSSLMSLSNNAPIICQKEDKRWYTKTYLLHSLFSSLRASKQIQLQVEDEK